MSELKPCPFCGGEGAYNGRGENAHKALGAAYPPYVGVNCIDCCATVGTLVEEYRTKEEAATAWNTRAGETGKDGSNVD